MLWYGGKLVWTCGLLICSIVSLVQSYYDRHKCFATGDCILSTAYFSGGYTDAYNRWLTECNDGEAIIGVFDAVRSFIGIEQVWCKFMFPFKPPAKGIYPFYPTCNVRNLTVPMKEFYCYDKLWPKDTSDTFAVGLFSAVFQDPGVPSLMKCCKTPAGYHIDYTRCEWKYTHDKRGEHYDGYWLTKCETGQIMTGLGQALNPNTNFNHFVWMQSFQNLSCMATNQQFCKRATRSGSMLCCPVIYLAGAVSKGQIYKLPAVQGGDYGQSGSRGGGGYE